MSELTSDQVEALREALLQQPQVRRAVFVADREKPTLVFEYDDRPPSVEEAQERLQRLLASARAALGDTMLEIGIAAGGPEEVAAMASGAEVVYERPVNA